MIKKIKTKIGLVGESGKRHSSSQSQPAGRGDTN